MIPTSRKEVEALGWDCIDIIIFSGDAFVDHPSFGTAVIARWLQKHGYRKRLRSDDAYTPDGRAGQRPDYAVTVYTRILKDLYPDVPVVIGGIEASLRRLTHYDYWKDDLMPSVLVSSGADWLCYGMGERPMLELTRAIESGRNPSAIRRIPQIAFRMTGTCKVRDAVILHPYEECRDSKVSFAENFHLIETCANMLHSPVIAEPVGDGYVQVNPPYPPATQQEMDSFWDLPFTKLPHPRYRGKRIPAYDMIKFSINTHRGCFGGCNFCTIAAHQGKFIQSRSEKSIVSEAESLRNLPGFAGNISDLGAPTANMYGMAGKNQDLCAKCRRKSCLFPSPCRNLDRSHRRLLDLYHRIAAIKGIRHSYIGSGIRYDLFLNGKGYVDDTSYPYLRELILEHTSGRLKVAPEHTEDNVLELMAKPSFRLFGQLRREFDRIVSASGRHCELVPYFISGHPGCGMREMERLSKNPVLKGLYMDQVQDFTPTPMTTSSVMFYTGLDPKSLKKVFVERDIERKRLQKSFFFK